MKKPITVERLVHDPSLISHIGKTPTCCPCCGKVTWYGGCRKYRRAKQRAYRKENRG